MDWETVAFEFQKRRFISQYIILKYHSAFLSVHFSKQSAAASISQIDISNFVMEHQHPPRA